jgi:hypothetical protein
MAQLQTGWTRTRPHRRAGCPHAGQHIATICRELGLITDDALLSGLMWDRNEDIEAHWLNPMLSLLAGLAVAIVVAYRSRRALSGVLAEVRALPLIATLLRPMLSLIMSSLFIGHSIPILVYNYSKNSAAIVSALNDAAIQTSQAGVERSSNSAQIGATCCRRLSAPQPTHALEPQSYAIALPNDSALQKPINVALLEVEESDWWKVILFRYLGQTVN